MDFATATNWPSHPGGYFTADLPETWLQGRALFGGVVAAVALRALQSLVSEDRHPLSVHAAFFAPVGPTGTRLACELLREGKSVTTGRALFVVDGEPRAQVTVMFGRHRPSSLRIDAPTRPHVAGPEGLPDIPFIPGMTPTFTQHFAYRWTDGAMPFSGASTAVVGGWCRHRTDPGPPHAALLGLADAWPSPALCLLTAPAPASTISWTVAFADVPAVVGTDDWWWLRSEALHTDAGYSHLRGALHRRSGQAALLFEQVLAVFDA